MFVINQKTVLIGLVFGLSALSVSVCSLLIDYKLNSAQERETELVGKYDQAMFWVSAALILLLMAFCYVYGRSMHDFESTRFDKTNKLFWLLLLLTSAVHVSVAFLGFYCAGTYNETAYETGGGILLTAVFLVGSVVGFTLYRKINIK